MYHTKVKKYSLFSVRELAFKDGLPMEDIISENRSCPMADYTEGKITETSILITCNKFMMVPKTCYLLTFKLEIVTCVSYPFRPPL